MGLAGLNSAISGLQAAQQQISVISSNVSNAGTPGYTRKILPQSSQSISGVTVGVLTDVITRNVNLNLQSDMWTQVSATDELEIQQTYLERIDKFHGDPSLEISIAAEIAALRNGFVALSDTPGDNVLQSQVVNQAQDVADKVNDFSDLLTGLRNDAQDDIQTSIIRVNQLLDLIADANHQIQGSENVQRSTAALEDQRDNAISELSGLLEITTFKRGDGVIVVQTNLGVQLADTLVEHLVFRPTAVTPATYYPASAGGVFVGDPTTNPVSAVDLTQASPGGKIGGLLNLRDTILPQQQAQLDEVAHKMALRFEAQGLMLFTDNTGSIPSDDPPNADTTAPPLLAVNYVGFSSVMQVNNSVLADNTLIQSGTYGSTTIESGSNEIIRRVVNFTFGDIEYQQAYNNDGTTSVDLENNGGADLQNWLGLLSSNTLTGGRDLTAFTNPTDFIASAGGLLGGTSDTLRLTFEENSTGVGPVSVDIDLSTVADGAGTFAQDLVTHINAQITATLTAPQIAALNPVAAVGPNGELTLTTNGSYIVDATNPANPMGQSGLNFLGLSENLTAVEPTDPYFDVQVGSKPAVRITLEPGDTHLTLLTKLNAVDGIVAQYDADGYLQIQAGDDTTFTDQNFGGDFKLIGGPFQTSSAGYSSPPATGGTRTSIDDGVGIVSALFGTYQDIDPGVGVIIENQSPITSIPYMSETEVNSGVFVPFRSNLLGPGYDISTEIINTDSLIEYAQKIVDHQAQRMIVVQNQFEDNEALKNLLETQFVNETGVNIDEEMASLIIYQTAFSASARVVNAVNDMFDELLRSI